MSSYLITDSAVTVTFASGKTKSLHRSHPHATQIIEALKNQTSEDELAYLFSKAEAIKRYMSGNVTVNEGGEVEYKGQVVNHTVADKIVAFMQQGLPYEPLVKFLDKLLENPSFRSVESLYDFLVNQDITIDSEGYLVCYKAVTADYLDKHTQTIDNHPHATVRMPRNQIDDNPDSACSRGLHAGSIGYVAGFAGPGDRILTVRINPRDVVSVPHDHNAQKMRVCEYYVIADVTGIAIPEVAPSPLYGDTDDDEDDNQNACNFGGVCAECSENNCDLREEAYEGETEVDVGGIRVSAEPGMSVKVETVDGKIVVRVTED